MATDIFSTYRHREFDIFNLKLLPELFVPQNLTIINFSLTFPENIPKQKWPISRNGTVILVYAIVVFPQQLALYFWFLSFAVHTPE
jgi:hypothetical protein